MTGNANYNIVMVEEKRKSLLGENTPKAMKLSVTQNVSGQKSKDLGTPNLSPAPPKEQDLPETINNAVYGHLILPRKIPKPYGHHDT